MVSIEGKHSTCCMHDSRGLHFDERKPPAPLRFGLGVYHDFYRPLSITTHGLECSLYSGRLDSEQLWDGRKVCPTILGARGVWESHGETCSVFSVCRLDKGAQTHCPIAIHIQKGIMKIILYCNIVTQ